MRDLDCSSAVNNLLYLASVFIAPSAELETKRKIRWHESAADDFAILFDDRFRFGTEENEKFQHSADRPESKSWIGHGCRICLGR